VPAEPLLCKRFYLGVSPSLSWGMAMARRLPSLNGFRAFEAAGRHGSFTAAARELNVTQTAVSRMVRLLEEGLGLSLFRRHANALELTAQGHAFLSGLTDSFNSIAALTEKVSAMRAGPVLTIGVPPTLAVNWLISRLTGFYRDHPDFEVRVATGGAQLPVRDDWTCTIRRDTSPWPSYVAEELFPSTVVPVCTPALARSLRRPLDLHKATLILVPHLSDDWPCWFEAAGLRMPTRPAGEVVFDHNAMAIQAALDGVGIAIAQPLYITDALKAGRLVAPFPIAASKRESWYLEYRRARETDEALLTFRNWLQGEAERQRQIEAELLGRSARPTLRKRGAPA
jgi:LysR family transcriptional regulator, regulator of gene expression of beta-lactamase